MKIIPDKIITYAAKNLDTDNWENGDYIFIEIWKSDDKIHVKTGSDKLSKKQLEKKEQEHWE